MAKTLNDKDKLKAVNIKSLDDLTKEDIDLIYKAHMKKKKKTIVKKKNNVKKIYEDDELYKVILEYLNKILENMNKEPIKKITEFKDIDRNDIIHERNSKILDDMEDKIFKVKIYAK